MATKKESLKSIIRALHEGLAPEEARRRVIDEVGRIETKELVQIEQELIDEGLPAEEVARFCNVHVLLVQDALEKGQPSGPGAASALPVAALTEDNARIQRAAERLRSLCIGEAHLDRKEVEAALQGLAGLDRHYGIKENLLFPYLEKHGFPGPSKVMWEKDNEIRTMAKRVGGELASLSPETDAAFRSSLTSFLDEVEGMITKEEQILLPAAVERLDGAEWARIAIEIEELGFGAAVKPSGTEGGIPPSASVKGGSVLLPSGRLTVGELEAVLNALPVDVTFVDEDGKVRYFNESKDRVFMRTRAVIGRSVENCHPPKSIAAVKNVIDELRTGKADHHDFWIQNRGRMIFIRYFAVRGTDGAYLGTLEVTQDVSEVRALQGEKRLLG